MKLDSYEMSAFLMYRTTRPLELHTIAENYPDRFPVRDSFELEEYLGQRVKAAAQKGKAALALSGGMDSAILAKFMPKGSIAYTFKCVVPGIQVIDETAAAAQFAAACGLQHRIVEVYWEDFENCSEILMRHKRSPIHSIEIQMYKAALQAKTDGIDMLIFGEAADTVYGGLDKILSQDWRIGDFIERFSYVMPYKVLKKPEIPIEAFKLFENDGYVDPYRFMSQQFIQESVSSYLNAIKTAGLETVLPYAETYLNDEIDYGRIRAGDSKYLVRELFRRMYPDFPIPPKTPMPRPMNEWLRDWEGPEREEFWPHCTDNMTGDQKWLVWILERFLNLLDE